jgi:hypothetical protein
MFFLFKARARISLPFNSYENQVIWHSEATNIFRALLDSFLLWLAPHL